MRRGLAVLMLMALPAWAGEPPPGCAWLCGSWTLDPSQSDAVETIIDTALEKEKKEQPDTLREELRILLGSPATLTLAEQGGEIVIRAPARAEQRLTANRSHARVDKQGTAEIRASWRSDDSLLVTESYDRRRKLSENYALQRDGTLVVTREVERPGIKRTKVRSVYRRS
jgi:hypothetical protein